MMLTVSSMIVSHLYQILKIVKGVKSLTALFTNVRIVNCVFRCRQSSYVTFVKFKLFQDQPFQNHSAKYLEMCKD